MGFMYCYGPSIGIIRSIDIKDIKELACGSMVRNGIKPDSNKKSGRIVKQMKSAVTLHKIKKTYITGKKETTIIKNLSLTIEEGSFIAVMGPSGSGKTTLLNVTSGIDKIDSGVVMILGVDITKMSSSDLADFRKHNIGIVFQDFNLIDSLNVKENIILPLDLCLLEASEIETLVNQKAKTLGIEKLLDRDVYEISGGEQQRVAICRAIINTPKVLFADEPTGNLDSKSTKSVMQYLRKVSFEEKCTIVMVTHDAFAASYSDKVLFFRDGQIVKELEKEADQSCFHKRLLQEQEEFSEDSFD